MTASDSLIVIERSFVVVCDVGGEPLSVTRTVKVAAPAPDGVPLITPALDSDNPPGSVPDWRDQAWGGVPPVAAKVVVV